MSEATMPASAQDSSRPSGPPPIAMLLPILQFLLAASSLLFRLGIRLLLAMVYPLRIIWSATYALLSPITTVVKITLDMLLFTPFSIVCVIAVALYPVYVFCAAACIVGAAFGCLGHYVSTVILGVLARSKYFIQPPSSPSSASPSGPQAMLRKRKRRYVRVQ